MTNEQAENTYKKEYISTKRERINYSKRIAKGFFSEMLLFEDWLRHYKINLL